MRTTRMMNSRRRPEPLEPPAEAAELADDPPPETVWPTLPLTAVMVPAKGAVRVVSDRVLVSVVTVACACVTWASSWRIVAGFT
jgi:hypothetical protein